MISFANLSRLLKSLFFGIIVKAIDVFFLSSLFDIDKLLKSTFLQYCVINFIKPLVSSGRIRVIEILIKLFSENFRSNLFNKYKETNIRDNPIIAALN